MTYENGITNGQEEADGPKANFLRRIMDKPGTLAAVIGVVSVALGVAAADTDGFESKAFTAGGLAGGIATAGLIIVACMHNFQNNETAH